MKFNIWVICLLFPTVLYSSFPQRTQNIVQAVIKQEAKIKDATAVIESKSYDRCDPGYIEEQERAFERFIKGTLKRANYPQDIREKILNENLRWFKDFMVPERESEGKREIFFKSPNKTRIVTRGSEWNITGGKRELIEEQDFLDISNGKIHWFYSPRTNHLSIERQNPKLHDSPFQILTPLLPNSEVDLLGEEALNGFECYVLKLVPNKLLRQDNIFFPICVNCDFIKIWIDKESYVWHKIEEQDEKARVILVRIATDFQKFNEGLLVPTRVEVKSQAKNNQGKTVASGTASITFNKVTLNQGLPDTLFEFKPPKGTKVIDSTKPLPKEYIQE